MLGRAQYLLLLCGVVAYSALAADEAFQQLPLDAYLHTPSGWVFPEAIGNFNRVQPPATLRSSDFAFARYSHSADPQRTVAQLTVRTMRPGGNKDSVRSMDSSAPLLLHAQGPFKVTDIPARFGRKESHRFANGDLINLYYSNSGKWTIGITIRGRASIQDIAAQMDAFVRAQSWDSLNWKDCIWCTQEGGLFRAAGAEQLAVLSVDRYVARVFPRTAKHCDVNSMSADLAGARSKFNSGSDAVTQLVHACKLNDTASVSVLRTWFSGSAKFKTGDFDGLSLTGPLTFLAYGDGSNSYFGQMYDGDINDNALAVMLRNVQSRGNDFAVGDRHGKNMQATLQSAPGANCEAYRQQLPAEIWRTICATSNSQ